jgi:hypothetical protein
VKAWCSGGAGRGGRRGSQRERGVHGGGKLEKTVRYREEERGSERSFGKSTGQWMRVSSHSREFPNYCDMSGGNVLTVEIMLGDARRGRKAPQRWNRVSVGYPVIFQVPDSGETLGRTGTAVLNETP